MGVLISFYIVPLGEGTSISRYVSEVAKTLKEKNVKFMMTPESTIIEAKDVNEGLKIIAEVHNKIMSMGVNRMVTVIKIDDRRDKELTLEIMKNKVDKILTGK
ncbi:MTH1187 family thiamine-binding protein [Desulfurococcaceae archaeon MEX13E-LK6-19]|nr:MTH1187 family thiamine-binding protein [Desulfurococcaceae archaeon MEX13E-LK6-19]